MDENEMFEIPPPSHDYGDNSGYMPTAEDIAFKLKLIEIRHQLDKISIDEDLKQEILCFIDPILTAASLTNIQPVQIREFLAEWRLKEITLGIDYPDSVTAEFRRVSRNIRILLKLQLNMSKMGWRGDQAFETHTKARYEVRQQQEQINRMEKWKRKMFGKSSEEESSV